MKSIAHINYKFAAERFNLQETGPCKNLYTWFKNVHFLCEIIHFGKLCAGSDGE
jgi:hypothetical protein